MFGLWLVVPRGTHRLFGNRHHPRTAGIIHLAEKLSTIFCDAFDKKRAAFLPFDRPSFDPLYSAFRARVTISGQVAQLVEHATENRGVGGSIPSLAINSMTGYGRSSERPFCFDPPALGLYIKAQARGHARRADARVRPRACACAVRRAAGRKLSAVDVSFVERYIARGRARENLFRKSDAPPHVF